MSQARIWNRFAKGYAKRPVADEASYAIKLEKTKALLSPDAQVLEVGCGTGSTALWHAPHVARIDATDFSDRMIEIAKAKAKAAGVSNVTFHVANADAPPPQAAYDAVLAMSLLHLLPDPAATLRHLASVLRPGGYLISSTVCLGEMGGFLPRLLPYLRFTGLIPSVKSLHKSDLLDIHMDENLTIIDEFQSGPDKALFLIAQSPGPDATL